MSEYVFLFLPHALQWCQSRSRVTPATSPHALFSLCKQKIFGCARRVSSGCPEQLLRQFLLWLPSSRLVFLVLGSTFSYIGIETGFLVSSQVEFEFFFSLFLVISEKRAGSFYSAISYWTCTLVNFMLVFISFCLKKWTFPNIILQF